MISVPLTVRDSFWLGMARLGALGRRVYVRGSSSGRHRYGDRRGRRGARTHPAVEEDEEVEARLGGDEAVAAPLSTESELSQKGRQLG